MTRTMLAIAFLAAAAGAATADCPPAAQTAAPMRTHVTRDANGTRVVIDTPIEICGHPPVPQVAYLTAALHIDYQWADVELDFMPLIIRSVQHRVFGGTEVQP